MDMSQLLISLMPKGGAPAITWTYVGRCVSSGTSLDFSALSGGSIQANDVAIYFDYAAANSVPSAVTPSGFTNVLNTSGQSGPGARGMISRKKLTGSEGIITGMSASTGGGSDENSKIGLVFRPSADFTTLTFSTPQDNGITDGDPSAINVDPSAETTPVVVLGVVASHTSSPLFDPPVSPSFDSEVTTNDMRTGYKIYTSSPASHSINTFDLGDAIWLAGVYFKAT